MTYDMRRPNVNTSELAALSTFIKLMRASESISKDVHAELKKQKLSISQFGILEALFHIGPMCQKEIGQKILKSSGNITMVIDNLEKAGLVQRSRNKNDRRSFLINLTPKGSSLIEKIFPAHAKRIAKRFEVLSKQEQQTLGTLLKKLKRDDS